ncbi:hypothetical protein ACFVQ3_14215 [Oerskovia sp. NPDC057915]|uniref:hypothetical protein n=1 Tax=Oerskovia sp. NPDC057915 TaxID=3346280 RepID=UPI0036D9C4D5
MVGRIVVAVVLVTVVTAGLARVGMRLVAQAADQDVHLGLTGTAGIAFLFLLAAVGGAVSGAVRWSQPWRTLPAAVGSALLLVAAASIGASEVSSALSAPGGSTLPVLAATAAILVAALACPVAAWRLGARARRRGDVPGASGPTG